MTIGRFFGGRCTKINRVGNRYRKIRWDRYREITKNIEIQIYTKGQIHREIQSYGDISLSLYIIVYSYRYKTTEVQDQDKRDKRVRDLCRL